MKKLQLPVKLLLPLLLVLFALCGASAQKAFPCDSICVESITMDTSIKNTLDVVIHNESSAFLNYPAVILIYKGDTVANKSGNVEFYGQLAKTRLTHKLPTTLKTIPANFKCTVAIRTWYGGRDTCVINYPCALSTSIAPIVKPEFGFTLYPDPVSSILIIKPNEGTNPSLNIRIYTMAGKEVIHENLNGIGESASINVEQLPKGIYLVRINDGSSIYTRKFARE